METKTTKNEKVAESIIAAVIALAIFAAIYTNLIA